MPDFKATLLQWPESTVAPLEPTVGLSDHPLNEPTPKVWSLIDLLDPHQTLIRPQEQRRRIIYLCDSTRPYGPQQSLFSLLQRLPESHYQIFVCAPEASDIKAAWQALPHVTWIHHPHIPLLMDEAAPWLKRLAIPSQSVFNLNAALQLAEFCQRFDIHAVHTNSLNAFEGALAAKLTGTPHVWHIREWFDQPNRKHQLLYGPWFTKALVHHFSDRVICLSETVKTQFEPFLQKNPALYDVLPNSVEVPSTSEPSVTSNLVTDTTPYAQSKTLRIVLIGKLSKTKRFQDVLKAFAILREWYPSTFHFQLDVYGEFEHPALMEWASAFIVRYDLGPFIQFHGYEPSLKTIFQDKDLLLQASSSEAMGRTLLEAMAHAVPVLAAKAGGPTEIVQEGLTGFFFMPNDPIDLAFQLRYLAQQRHQLLAMKSSCLSTVYHYYNAQSAYVYLHQLYAELSPAIRQLTAQVLA